MEDLDVDVKIQLKWILKEWWEGMDCMNLVQDKDMWQASLNTVMNFQVPYNTGNFSTSRWTTSFSRMTLLYGVSY